MKPRGPYEVPAEDKNKILVRGFSGRVDLFDDQFLIRAGLFVPSFGLNLIDHTAYVRNAVGLGADSEQSQVEATFQSEALEVGAAAIFVNEGFDRKEQTKSGAALHASTFIASKHRLNLSYLSLGTARGGVTSRRQSIGISGSLALSKRSFLLGEIDQTLALIESSLFELKTSSLASFMTLNYEVFRGVIPFVRHEFYDPNQKEKKDSLNRSGLGLAWHPRPHFQLESRILRTVYEDVANKANDSVEGIIHYYF
jgi:hypothetical protein